MALKQSLSNNFFFLAPLYQYYYFCPSLKIPILFVSSFLIDFLPREPLRHHSYFCPFLTVVNLMRTCFYLLCQSEPLIYHTSTTYVHYKTTYSACFGIYVLNRPLFFTLLMPNRTTTFNTYLQR